MTFKYEFLVEENENKLIEPGIYKFRIIKSIQKISKNNNKMFSLVLKIEETDPPAVIYSSLIFAQAGLCKKNISNFCKCVNIPDFENKEFREDFSSLEGLAAIAIEKDKSGKYPDKNIVEDWIYNEQLKENESSMYDNKDIPNDEIPF